MVTLSIILVLAASLVGLPIFVSYYLADREKADAPVQTAEVSWDDGITSELKSANESMIWLELLNSDESQILPSSAE